MCTFFVVILHFTLGVVDIWEIPRSEIVLGKELGTGQFGVSKMPLVYRRYETTDFTVIYPLMASYLGP